MKNLQYSKLNHVPFGTNVVVRRVRLTQTFDDVTLDDFYFWFL